MVDVLHVRQNIMRAFRQIDLVLKDGFSDAERKAVTMGSRSMLNFVERQLAPVAFSAEFTRLNVYCSRLPVIESLERHKEPWLAGIRVHYAPGDFLLSTTSFHSACAEMVQRGVRAASVHTPIPVEQIASAIADFLDGGCVNQWVHADRRWIRIGARSVVTCELRTDLFLLRQFVYRDGVLESNALIGTSKPREGLYNSILGSLSLSGDEIQYRSKANVISSYDLKRGIFVTLSVDKEEAEQIAAEQPAISYPIP